MSALEKFESRLSGDETKLRRDESKDASRLQRDESKADAFAAKLGVKGDEMRVALDAQMAPSAPRSMVSDAGAYAGTSDASQRAALEQAGVMRPGLPPSMGDTGGPSMGAPLGPPPGPGEAMAFGPGANPIPLSQRLMQNVQGAGPAPGSVPVSQTPNAMGLPVGPGGPPPDYITNPGKYQDPSMGRPPGYMLNATLARPVPGGGGGGGGPNLQAPVNAANAATLGTFDDERSHRWQAALQHGQSTGDMADVHQAEAARQERAALDAQKTEAEARQKQYSYLQATDKMNNAFASGEIDPNRAFHNADTGTKVAMGIAAFLGGIVPGVRQLSNLVFGNAHDDMEAQKEAYERKGSALKNRDTLFGHFMKLNGDTALSGLQTRNALIEAQKVNMQAQADRLGIPEAKTNAKVGIDLLNREQDKLKSTIAEHAKAVADSQAAAGAAARSKAESTLWQHGLDIANLRDKEEGRSIERMKAEADAGKKPGQTDFEKKREETQHELDGQLAAFSGKLDPIVAGGPLGNALGGLPAWVPGAAGARNDAANRESYNTKLLVGAGAAYRWGSGGMEPKNHEIIEHMIAPYKILPTDNKKTAEAKNAAFKEYLRQEAAGKGAVATMPDSVKLK